MHGIDRRANVDVFALNDGRDQRQLDRAAAGFGQVDIVLFEGLEAGFRGCDDIVSGLDSGKRDVARRIRLARGNEVRAGLDLDAGAGYRLAAGIQNCDIDGGLRERLGTQHRHLPEQQASQCYWTEEPHSIFHAVNHSSIGPERTTLKCG